MCRNATIGTPKSIVVTRPAVFEPDKEPLPPPRYRSKPRWPLDADEPLPLEPRRTVLSAPPPFDEGPTPIRPTPHFGPKIEPPAN